MICNDSASFFFVDESLDHISTAWALEMGFNRACNQERCVLPWYCMLPALQGADWR
jgi:hypothetical protein